MDASVPPASDDPVAEALAKQAQAAIAAGIPQAKVAGRVAQMTAHLNEHPELQDGAARALARGVDPNLVFARLAQMSQGKAVQDAPEPRSTAEDVTGAIQSAIQGATFGAGNKIAAGIEALAPESLGGTKGFDLKQAFQDQTSSLNAFRAAHPVASTALEIAGGIPTALATGGVLEAVPGLGGATSALGRIGQAAARGAIQGGSYGALSSDDLSPSDIASRAAKGAVAGGALGSVFQAVPEGARALGGGLNALKTAGDLAQIATRGPMGKAYAAQRILARYLPTSVSEDIVPAAEGLEPVGASVGGPTPTGALRNLRNAPSPTFEGDVDVPAETSAKPAFANDASTISPADQQRLIDLGVPPERIAAAHYRAAVSPKVLDVLKQQQPSDITSTLTSALNKLKASRPGGPGGNGWTDAEEAMGTAPPQRQAIVDQVKPQPATLADYLQARMRNPSLPSPSPDVLRSLGIVP